MSQVTQPKRGHYSLWLLASIVVALLLDTLVLGLAKFLWCGISGCSGAGFGISRSVGETVACFIVIAVITFIAVALPPWTPGWRRPVVAAAAGLAAAGIAVAIVVSQR